MRILFVTSNRIGDAVLSTGLLDHLIRTQPQSRITVACGPVAEGVFLRMPNLAKIITMQKQRYGMHWLPLWASSVGLYWNMIIDIRSSAISYLVPAGRRAVMRKRLGHKTEQLAGILGVRPPPLPVAWTAPADRARARELLPAGPPIIALAPTANWVGKVWPADRFATMFRLLAADHLPGARAVILAGPGEAERALAASLLARLPSAIDLTGRLSLPEAAACLARCTLFVGNDSGLMHLSAASDTPTLGLFGPTPAAEYAPVGPRTAVAVAPSGRMGDLSVADALNAACNLLKVAQVR
jgi:ADP-heptose:LPS heptosyltransferase